MSGVMDSGFLKKGGLSDRAQAFAHKTCSSVRLAIGRTMKVVLLRQEQIVVVYTLPTSI